MNEKKDYSNRLESIKLLYEFQMKLIDNAVNILIKGMPIYVTILAALVGYFLIQENSKTTKGYVIFIGISATIGIIIVYSVITKAIINGLNSICKTLESSDQELYKELELNKFVGKIKFAILFGLLIASVVAIIFSIGLLLI